MLRRRLAVLVTLCVLACREAPAARSAVPPTPTTAPPAPVASARPPSALLPAGYALRDTAVYANETSTAQRALLYGPAGLIDTVDLWFGVQVVGHDSLLFVPVRSYLLDSGERFGVEITEHVLLHAGQRLPLRTILPELDDYFSSPAVYGQALYYWGLAPDSTVEGRYALTARRFHFPTGQRDSLPLGRVEMATDSRVHLAPPRWEGDRLVYAMGEVRWHWTPPTLP